MDGNFPEQLGTPARMLSSGELERYKRNILLAEVGIEGQTRLVNSRVLIIGAGGLGSPVALYLAAAGVGCIGIVDEDEVDLTNLQRQILFAENQIGVHKAVASASRIKSLNSDITCVPHLARLSVENAEALIGRYEVVIDCSDNFETRYLVNDTCLNLGIPLVYASIYRFEGQVSFFNFSRPRLQRGPCYRCLYPQFPQGILSCREVGVLGVVAGVVGALQANEVLKYLLSQGNLLEGRLLLFDALDTSFSEVGYSVSQDCLCRGELVSISGASCVAAHATDSIAPAISAGELVLKLSAGEDISLLDVRTVEERRALFIQNSLHISLERLAADLAAEVAELRSLIGERPVVVYCRSGVRSREAVDWLRSCGVTAVNLSGGILGLCREFGEEYICRD